MTTTNTTSPHSSPLTHDAPPGVFCLDASYATTRLVTSELPVIENPPDAKFTSMLFLPANPERKGEGGLRTRGYFKRSLSDKPLITVITVVFNGAKTLEDTIKSVISQTYANVEYIIIDGGSTDGALDIIRKYNGQIDYWVSEPDKGISCAFNKGITICTGIYHLMLNADDWYETDAVQTLVDTLLDGTIVACAHATIYSVHGKPVNHFIAAPSRLFWKMSLPHNCCLTKTATVKELGGYNRARKIAMDHELFLKILTVYGAEAFSVAHKAIGNYSMGGVSDRQIINGFREVRANIRTITRKKILADIAFLVLVCKAFLSKISFLNSAITLYKKIFLKNG